MLVSQKALYALRALFEFAKRKGQGPIKVAEVARMQAIPKRFLEVILGQLKREGILESKRGNEGGYQLLRSPNDVTVGDVIRSIQGPIGQVGCSETQCKAVCPLYGGCVFSNLWEKVGSSITSIYDNTTLQDLLEEDGRNAEKYATSYSI